MFFSIVIFVSIFNVFHLRIIYVPHRFLSFAMCLYCNLDVTTYFIMLIFLIIFGPHQLLIVFIVVYAIQFVKILYGNKENNELNAYYSDER